MILQEKFSLRARTFVAQILLPNDGNSLVLLLGALRELQPELRHIEPRPPRAIVQRGLGALEAFRRSLPASF